MATGAATAIAASRTSAFGLASVLHASTQRSPIVSSMYAAGKDVVVRPTGGTQLLAARLRGVRVQAYQ
jgi:hypothetical protein